MNELSIEKQFAHIRFCQQVENLNLEEAKQSLRALHLLYLEQQAVFSKLIIPDFSREENRNGI